MMSIMQIQQNQKEQLWRWVVMVNLFHWKYRSPSGLVAEICKGETESLPVSPETENVKDPLETVNSATTEWDI